MIPVMAGCSVSNNKQAISQSPTPPAVASTKSTVHPLLESNVKYKAQSTPPVHKVVYKEGEYPTKPSWMTQKQWNSYIDWESNRMTKRETPRWDEDAELIKVLRRKFGSRLREASTSKGSDQTDPVPGWVAEVDIYSNRSQSDADMYVTQAYETVFASNLNVNRVIVNICLHEEPVDGTIYFTDRYTP